jgi:hypothetical protein
LRFTKCAADLIHTHCCISAAYGFNELSSQLSTRSVCSGTWL